MENTWLSTNQKRRRASRFDNPFSSMTLTIAWATPVPADPAPKKTNFCFFKGVEINLQALIKPAAITAPVLKKDKKYLRILFGYLRKRIRSLSLYPWISSLKHKSLSLYLSSKVKQWSKEKLKIKEWNYELKKWNLLLEKSSNWTKALGHLSFTAIKNSSTSG